MTARHFAFASLLLIGSAIVAVAQPLPPVAPPLPPPQVANQSGTGIQGRVARLLPTPHGEVDGLLLEDGRLVRFPPHLSAALLGVVGQGDAVVVDGMQAGIGTDVRGWRITNPTTGRSVTDAPPPFPPEPRAWSERDMRVSGIVRRALTGGRGETNGVILDDGTVVRFPPPVGEAFATLVVPGARLIAQGYGSSGPAGTAIEAVALGSSERDLMAVDPRSRAVGPRGR
jgi:hypothetical protein